MKAQLFTLHVTHIHDIQNGDFVHDHRYGKFSDITARYVPLNDHLYNLCTEH